MRIRLLGTPAEVEVALHRLRDAFSTVVASEPRPCRQDRGLVRVYCRVSF